MDDERLVHAARAGSVESFNLLVERYQGPIFNLCTRMLGSREAAEDATQETFWAAWRHLERFEGANFKAWLYRIASNHCLDQLRARRRRQHISLEPIEFEDGTQLEPADPEPGPEAMAVAAGFAAALGEAMAEIAPDQRLAVVLCDLQGLSYDEIAEITETTLGTVKSRINRGRQALRTVLQARHGELLPSRYRRE